MGLIVADLVIFVAGIVAGAILVAAATSRRNAQLERELNGYRETEDWGD